MRPLAIIRAFLCLFVAGLPSSYAEEQRKLPEFPLQFTCDLETTAHLVDRTKDYPPWLRKIKIHYDYINKLARAEISHGYEAGRTYYRRYDQKKEYMVRSGEFAECQRSYLGEDMPFPELPKTMTFQDIVKIDGRDCEHWVEDLGVERVHVYQSVDTKEPVRLVDESVEDSVSTPLMTYDFKNFKQGEPEKTAFALPAPYTHKKCQRHVGGFPYLHLFHYYLRF